MPGAPLPAAVVADALPEVVVLLLEVVFAVVPIAVA